MKTLHQFITFLFNYFSKMRNPTHKFSDMRSTFVFYMLAGILITGMAGCSTAEMTADRPSSEPEVRTERDYEKMEEIYWARIDSSKMSFTDADVEYMTGMIGHHAQALIMSDLAPKNDASPSVRRLAARIINAQNDEIESMQRWLRDRNQPVPTVEIDGLILNISMEMPEEEMEGGMDMEHDTNHEMDHDMSGQEMDHVEEQMDHSSMGHHGMDHSNMPGMLTQEQLNELGRLRGEEFDRKFLLYMIDHHQGAVIMSDTLFDTDGAALDEEAFRLGADIKVDQETEIERMQLMLREMQEE